MHSNRKAPFWAVRGARVPHVIYYVMITDSLSKKIIWVWIVEVLLVHVVLEYQVHQSLDRGNETTLTY